MKVFIVEHGESHLRCVSGVFSTQPKALQFAKAIGGDERDVSEFEVDEYEVAADEVGGSKCAP